MCSLSLKMAVLSLLQKEPLIKIIHLKSQSVDLPIYTSNLSNLTLIEETQKQTSAAMDAKVGLLHTNACKMHWKIILLFDQLSIFVKLKDSSLHWFGTCFTLLI